MYSQGARRMCHIHRLLPAECLQCEAAPGLAAHVQVANYAATGAVIDVPPSAHKRMLGVVIGAATGSGHDDNRWGSAFQKLLLLACGLAAGPDTAQQCGLTAPPWLSAPQQLQRSALAVAARKTAPENTRCRIECATEQVCHQTNDEVLHD